MYEITFITLDEEKNKLVKKILEEHKAKINLELPLGKKTFAYPIKKEKAGYYTTFYFDIAGSELASVNKIMQAEKEILRFLLIKSEQNIEEVKAYLTKEKKPIVKKDASEQENAIEETVEDEAVENDLPVVTNEKESAEVKEETPKKAKKEVKKVKKTVVKEKTKVAKPETKETQGQDRIKKLEEKLDELLKE